MKPNNPFSLLGTQIKNAIGLNSSKMIHFPFDTATNMGKDFKKRLAADFTTMLGLGILAGALVIGGITVLILVIFIINASGFVTPRAASLMCSFDPGGGFADPTSCPLIGGTMTCSSYYPSMENGPGCSHGTVYYFSPSVYSGNCYTIPQGTGCGHPIPDNGNRCSSVGGACSEYGYAADFAGGPGGTPVYLPLVNGQPATDWSCHYVWHTSGGDRVDCDTSAEGGVHLQLTHVQREANSDNSGMSSGTQVATLYVQAGAHLHLEVQIAGVWVRPENYFCGGSAGP